MKSNHVTPLPRTCSGLAVLLITAATTLAQPWFTQRTTEAGSRPVRTGLADGFLPPAATAEAGAVRAAAAAVPAIREFAAVGLPKTIPDSDATGVTSTVTIPAGTAGSNLLFSCNIKHTYRGDLIVKLKSPGGTEFVVSNRAGGGSDNILIARQTMSVPAGQSLAGVWTLSIADVSGGDAGSLDSFTLGIASGVSYIDLTIGLSANPLGDGDGNTQGKVGSEQQDKWERIVQHYADAVFEMTNGAHRIQEVRIFTNNKNFGSADIRWAPSGHPHVPAQGGVGVAGGHINMFEVFTGGSGGGVDKDMLADEPGSGYTMAHEWSHYFLALYDEYQIDTNDVPVSPSIMNSQWKAKADKDWLNFSIKRTTGGSFQNTTFTKQHRAYGASAWETLARPTASDPSDATSKAYQSLGPRIYYPELLAVAPAAGATPRIDLPSADARANLNIIWMQDFLTMEIVIDRSGSMSGAPLAQAISAASLLVDQLPLGTSQIGVTIFDDEVSSLVAITPVTTAAEKASIKAAIATITARNDTAIGDAAASALAKVLAAPTIAAKKETQNRVVFLLSDGQSNTGRDPSSVMGDYAAAKIPLFTFGFGSGADTATLSALSGGTGGKFFYSPNNLASISRAFLLANQSASSLPGLDAGLAVATPVAPATVPFTVDSTLNRLQLTASYTGTPAASTVTLVNPGGQTIAASSTSQVGNENLVFFDVSNPPAGTWQLKQLTTAATSTLNYSVSGINRGIGYDASASLQDGTLTVNQAGPVILQGKLSRVLAIAGAAVTATVTAPDQTKTSLVLKDDGVYPDANANDGTYTAAYIQKGKGIYTANLRFSNETLGAKETYVGAIFSPTVTGELVRTPADAPVPEKFVRSQEIQFTVNTDVLTQAPVIPTQPSHQSVVVGGSATITLSALGIPAPTYQWQRMAAGTTTWVNLTNTGGYSAATTTALTLTNVTAAMHGDQFRCVVTNPVSSVTSNAVTLSVGALSGITTQPANRAITTGTATTFSVAATGTPAPAFQWQYQAPGMGYWASLTDGGVYAGTATTTLAVSNAVSSLNNLQYRCAVTNAFGTVFSNAATLSVSGTNAALTIATQPQAQTVTNGGSLVLSVSVTGGSGSPTYQWRLNGTPVANATGSTYNPSSLGFAGAGAYDVVIRDGSLTVTSSPVTVTVMPVSRISNLSILTSIRSTDPLFTVGTVIGGEGTGGSKPLLVRAAGPSLTALGVGGPLSDPMLDLYSGQTVMASNDNWGGTGALSTAFAQVGAFAYSSAASRDAAVYNPTMRAGGYTVQVTGVAGATGTVIAELYDATAADLFTVTTPRLINVSVLKRISAGEILTAGFVIAGSTPKAVLIRAVGPTLASAPFNVAGAMTDPKLDLFRGQTVINANDDWGGGSALAAAFARVGAFALGATSRDAALLVTLPPGNYTAQVSGVGGATGTALVEVYEVP